MRKVSLIAAGVVFALGGQLFAGEECKKEGQACASEKVAKLLASWKAAVEEDKGLCADERTKVQTALASAAKDCPLGSRMGSTLAFTKAVLDQALAAEEACSKSCPLAKAEAKEGAAGACPEVAKVKEARTALLKDLAQLAAFAVAAAPSGDKAACCKEGEKAVETASSPLGPSKGTAAAKGFCPEKAGKIVAAVRAESCDTGAAAILLNEIEGLKCEKKAGELVAALRAEACEEGARKLVISAAEGIAKSSAPAKETAAKSGACCKEGAKAVETASSPSPLGPSKGTVAKAGACCAEGGSCGDPIACAAKLKASWQKAPAEVAGMCPQKRKELVAAVGSLSQRSKAVTLVPESVLALADGLDALEAMSSKLAEWGKANPDALKSVPEEAKKAFERQGALIGAGASVLRQVREAVKACGGECGSAKKTETASTK